MLSAQAVLLGNSRQAKWLARETSAQYVERRDILDGHFSNVFTWDFMEVGLVCLSRELVPVTGENTLTARSLKREAEPTNATEQIYKA
jgi:hypothetical protein